MFSDFVRNDFFISGIRFSSPCFGFDSIPKRSDQINRAVGLRLWPTVPAEFSSHSAHLLTGLFSWSCHPSWSCHTLENTHTRYKCVSEEMLSFICVCLFIVIIIIVGLQRGRGKGPVHVFIPFPWQPPGPFPGPSLPFHQELNPAKLGALP